MRTQNRVAPGVSTGGQFTTQTKTEASISLVDPVALAHARNLGRGKSLGTRKALIVEVVARQAQTEAEAHASSLRHRFLNSETPKTLTGRIAQSRARTAIAAAASVAPRPRSAEQLRERLSSPHTSALATRLAEARAAQEAHGVTRQANAQTHTLQDRRAS